MSLHYSEVFFVKPAKRWKYQAAFSIFTAQTLYSGILATGSKAEFVRMLAEFSAK
jgi:hypothetical protein